MSETRFELLVYNGNEFFCGQIRQPAFCVGNHPDSIITLPPPVGGGTAVLYYEYCDARWFARCVGEAFENGKRIPPLLDNAIDHLIILDQEAGIAVQLVQAYSYPARQLDLFGIESIRIGRKEQNELCLMDVRVSGSHAVLYRENDTWYIRDTDSTNGTWAEGRRVTEPMALRENLRVHIMQFSFLLRDGKLLVSGPSALIGTNLRRSKEAHTPYITRSPRFIEKLPEGEVEIEAAPDTMAKPQFNWVQILLPSIGSFAAMMLVTYLIGYSSMMAIFSLPMAAISLLVALLTYRSQKKKYRGEQALLKERYEEYLHQKQEEIRNAAGTQQRILEGLNPPPAEFRAMLEKKDRILFGRVPQDEDFLSLRAGTGTVPLSLKVKTPKIGFSLHEKQYQHSPAEIAEQYREIPAPVCIDFLKTPTLGITGKREDINEAARNLILQAAIHHSYEECKIVIVFPEEEKEEWLWARWLPHVFDQSRSVRYMACTQYDVTRLLTAIESELRSRQTGAQNEYSMSGSNLQMPYYLFVIAAPRMLDGQPVTRMLLGNDRLLGVGTVILTESIRNLPQQTLSILETGDAQYRLYERQETTFSILFQPDHVSLSYADEIARHLAPLRLPESGSEELLPATVTFLEGYHVDRPEELEIAEFWSQARPEITMSVPIGVRANGENFDFDIHEDAHGPHGLVAGTTGSGKTEMVQSWILSMALQFSPQQVSFVLIDFKGTGLILPFSDLPHLAGTISDLDTQIDRNLIALKAELQRRKDLFDASGCEKIKSYQELYRMGRVREPLSYLFIVIDEYAEFKSRFPDFTTEINSIARTGRSLGVHVILMTQNPSGIVTAETESNIKFRWCLKVASVSASREVLGGHAEAARLSDPGRAYVRVGTDEVFEPIQSFYSGAPYVQGEAMRRNAVAADIKRVMLDGRRMASGGGARAGEALRGKQTEISAVVRYISEYSRQHGIPYARQVWSGKLPEHVFLSDVLKRTRVEEGELTPCVGLIDDPAVQRQYPLLLPLSTQGHAVVYGAPGSGKTTFLQTLILAACRMYTPDRVQMYLMDFGSWSFGMFREFPHVGSVANDNEEEKIEKTAQLIRDVLDERKSLFATAGVGSIQAYNRTGREILPYILLIVDNFVPVLQLFPQLDEFFLRLTREGGNYGIILVASSNTANGMGYRIQQNIRTSVALQMSDPGDYMGIVGKTGGLLPEGFTGRGLYREEAVCEFQTALPGDSVNDNDRSAAIREEGAGQNASWEGARPKPLQIMPEVVTKEMVHADAKSFALGLASGDISSFGIPVWENHTLLISGTARSGKTNLLHVLLWQMLQMPDADVVLYGKQEEYPAVTDPHVRLIRNGAEFDSFLEELVPVLQQRKERKDAGEAVTDGPLFILIDDYDELTETISEASSNRLNAIVRIGEGICVMLVVTADNAYLNRMNGLELTLSGMGANRMILLGGCVRDHIMAQSGLDAVAKGEQMRPYEAYYCKNNTSTRFKAIHMREADGEEQTMR